MSTEFYGWPLTDEGPVISPAEAKGARIQLLMLTHPGDHPVRPDYGIPLDDTLFDNYIQETVEAVLRIAVRNAAARFEPGIIIGSDANAVQMVQTDGGKHILKIQWRDIEEPEVIQDPLEVRLRSA